MNYINLDISALDECLLESASLRRDKHTIISVALQIAFAFIKRNTNEMSLDGFRVAIKRSGLTMNEANKVMDVCPSVLEEVNGYIKCHLATATVKFSKEESARGSAGGKKSRKVKPMESSADAINAAILANKGTYVVPIKE